MGQHLRSPAAKMHATIRRRTTPEQAVSHIAQRRERARRRNLELLGIDRIEPLVIPAHLHGCDHRGKAAHAQRMLNARRDGGGFRVIPDDSDEMSVVERHLVAAGDMLPPRQELTAKQRKRLDQEALYRERVVATGGGRRYPVEARAY